jgi:hypothetical protein
MKQKIDVVFSKKSLAQKLLYQYLVNEVELILDALMIFYLPLALIEEASPEEKVDQAADESVAKLKAQIEIIEKQRSRYTSPSTLASANRDADKSIMEEDESDKEGEKRLEDFFILWENHN